MAWNTIIVTFWAKIEVILLTKQLFFIIKKNNTKKFLNISVTDNEFLQIELLLYSSSNHYTWFKYLYNILLTSYIYLNTNAIYYLI
jgi:hypothetical protein